MGSYRVAKIQINFKDISRIPIKLGSNKDIDK